MVRSKPMKSCRFLVSALVLGALFAPSAGAAVRYRVTEIPTFGGDWSSAAAINEQGHVTGTAAFRRDRLGSDAHAYVYADGALTDLGALVRRHDEFVESFSDGRAINAADLVAGDELSRSGDAHPVLFTPARTTFTQDTWFQMIAYGINDAGD